MINEIMHVGLTVKNLDRSVDFYKNTLGLKYLGEILMEGKETELLFNRKNARARVAYLNGSDKIHTPPVELIQFIDEEIVEDKSDLFKTSISEICFNVDDIYNVYDSLKAKGVEFISDPQKFDFTSSGFGKSIAVYFKDTDGIIFELMQNVD